MKNIKNFNLRSVVPDGLWNWSTRVLLPVMLREIVEIRSPRMAPGECTGEIALESAIPDAFWSVSFQPDTSQDPSHAGLTLDPPSDLRLVLLTSSLLILDLFLIFGNVDGWWRSSWRFIVAVSSTSGTSGCRRNISHLPDLNSFRID
jgi:hypothetical protein